jgi:FO synthase
MAQALVPLKNLVQAKSRLAGLLQPSERCALAQAMAEDVLQVLSSHASITRITLVCDDPGAELLAQKYGADCWSERSLGGSGLNALIQSASERLLIDAADTLVVLHADLPLLACDPAQGCTAQLLCDSELGSRLTLALATVLDGVNSIDITEGGLAN